MPPPGVNEDLGLLERQEDLPAEQFIAQLSVEGLIISVFPR